MDPLLAAGAPLVLGLVQAFRPVVADRFLPILSLVLGLGVVALYAVSGGIPWAQTPLAGLMVGLSASGLYSGSRATVNQ